MHCIINEVLILTFFLKVFRKELMDPEEIDGIDGISHLSLETDGCIIESKIDQKRGEDSAYFSQDPLLSSAVSLTEVHPSVQTDVLPEDEYPTPSIVYPQHISAQAIEITQEYDYHGFPSSPQPQTPPYNSIPAVNSEERKPQNTFTIADPNIQKMIHADKDGDTQLHLAITKNHVPVAIYIIQCLATINVNLLNLQNNLLQTPLWLAIYEQQLDVVEMLIRSGADITAADRNGNTPLHVASEYGLDEFLDFLLRNAGRAMICRCLSVPNYGGQTCLHLAADGMHLSAIRLLLRHGVDLNEEEKVHGMTILHKAAKSGNKILLEYILNLQGLDLSPVTYAGDTPILLAYLEGHADIVSLLKQEGCNLQDLP